MKTFICKITQILLILLIILTIAHAFYQSSLPMKESAENSSKVEEIIEEVIPPETKPGAFIKENIRKLAHFTEFFLLGLWCVLFTLLLKKKRAAAVSLIPFGMIAALLDETVQIFSERGSSVKDIWIDIFGYASAVFLVLVICLLIFCVRKLIRAIRY